MVANNQTIIYDIEADTETILPDIPNGVSVTAPTDGSAILLPLSPPDYTPEVLVCGGSSIDQTLQPGNFSSQHPASSQCARMTITPEGIAKGWEVEHMLEPRTLLELLHLPNGQILVTNGAIFSSRKEFYLKVQTILVHRGITASGYNETWHVALVCLETVTYPPLSRT